MNERMRGYAGTYPDAGDPVYIDPLAVVIGDVQLGDHVSIWPHAVIRGDVNTIRIGSWTNIQDNCVVHTGWNHATDIGSYCVVGHGAILHGCTVGDGCMVGMGSIIMNGSLIGDGCLIGAGTLITEGKTFAPGSLILGSPGKVIRNLEEGEISHIRDAARQYWETALSHMR